MGIGYLLHLIDQTGKTPGRTEKLDLLQQIRESEDSATFTEACELMFNPYVTFGVTPPKIKDAEYPKVFAHDSLVVPEFFSILGRLASRELTGSAAKDEIRSLFLQAGPEKSRFFSMVLGKSFGTGVSVGLVQRVFPEITIPKFELSLCTDLDEGKHLVEGYPARLVEPKIDGVRGLVGNLDGKSYRAWSRGGREIWNADRIVELLHGLCPGHVIDGEFLCRGDFSTTMSVCKSQGAHPFAEELEYHVFDMIPASYWRRETDECDPLSIRRAQIESVVKLANSVDPCVRIRIVEACMVESVEQLREVAASHVSAGWEGVVVKEVDARYEFGRGTHWLRWKPFKSGDFRVSSVHTGYRNYITGTVHAAEDVTGDIQVINGIPFDLVIRQIVVEDQEGVQTSVGYGYSMQDRIELAAMGDKLVGKIMEVKYQCLASNGALRFPTFLRMRPDKDE